MRITTAAIVIHSLRFGEADLIVKLFTKTSGLKSYLLKGILKSKRGRIKSSLFQPLMLIEIEATHKNKGTLERIQEAKVLTPYNTLHVQIIKGSLVLFLSEVLKNSIQEEEENVLLYEYLETSFLWLDAHESIANFHLIFLLKLTKYLGFYPDTNSFDLPYFDLQEGIFQPQLTNLNCIEGEDLLVLKQFLGTTFDEGIRIKLSKKKRSDFLNLLLTYYELHLQGFTKLKSLTILNEIYT